MKKEINEHVSNSFKDIYMKRVEQLKDHNHTISIVYRTDSGYDKRTEGEYNTMTRLVKLGRIVCPIKELRNWMNKFYNVDLVSWEVI